MAIESKTDNEEHFEVINSITNDIEYNTTTSSAVDTILMPELKKLTKYCFPETIWKQNFYALKIIVNAVNFKNYKVQIEKDFVYVIIEDEDGDYRDMCINLFGIIDTEYSWAIVRGNFIHINLLKSLRININWPRILQNDAKYHWLRYDLNSISCDYEDEGKI